MVSGYEAYCINQAIYLHFHNEKYNYFVYNGKVNVSEDSFESRKDKYHFYKLSRKYTSKEELINFFLANYFYRDIKWTGELMDVNADKVYKEYLKRKQAITYTFQSDIECLVDATLTKNMSLDDFMVCKGGQDPILLTFVYQNKISRETLIILDMLFDFMKIWAKKITDEIVFPKFYQKHKKFKVWCKDYDTEKFRQILKKVLTSQ